MEQANGNLRSVLGAPRPADLEIVCGGCRRRPHLIPELVEQVADDLEVSNPSVTMIDNWVRLGEGTFNPNVNRFLCDACYIRAGMPSLPAPDQWVCP